MNREKITPKATRETEEVDDAMEFSFQMEGLDFWHDEREELYQDYLQQTTTFGDLNGK